MVYHDVRRLSELEGDMASTSPVVKSRSQVQWAVGHLLMIWEGVSADSAVEDVR